MNRKREADAKKFDRFVNAKTVEKLPAFMKQMEKERDKQLWAYWSAVLKERKQAERYRYEMLCAQSSAKFWRAAAIVAYVLSGILIIISGVIK